jgi:hypothetical protein
MMNSPRSSVVARRRSPVSIRRNSTTTFESRSFEGLLSEPRIEALDVCASAIEAHKEMHKVAKQMILIFTIIPGEAGCILNAATPHAPFQDLFRPILININGARTAIVAGRSQVIACHNQDAPQRSPAPSAVNSQCQ